MQGTFISMGDLLFTSTHQIFFASFISFSLTSSFFFNENEKRGTTFEAFSIEKANIKVQEEEEQNKKKIFFRVMISFHLSSRLLDEGS